MSCVQICNVISIILALSFIFKITTNKFCPDDKKLVMETLEVFFSQIMFTMNDYTVVLKDSRGTSGIDVSVHAQI